MDKVEEIKKILPLELRKLGLTDKEARVYLAFLELGYTSIQQIAQKAQISRPTAYEVIKSLEKKNLIIKSKEKGKKYLTAQSPDNLLGILRRQKRELEEKEREFIRIISILRAKYYLERAQEIKIFQGKNSLKFLLNDLATSSSKRVYSFITENKILPSNQREKIYQKLKKRLRKIQIKELVSERKGEKSAPLFLERKFVSEQASLPFKGIVIIYDKLIILTPKTNFLIEDEILIKLLTSLFEIIWKNQTKKKKP